ncbi:acetyl-CoA carboxylase biotin carboxylase subunit family protein [Streptomyces sp. NPDC059382]|uniref:ATP-grasp domain-containing protein n=1 Tax=Streptomyces sp. NPDC059382 TaxID=3346816 RepID=UPI00367845E1
MSRVLLVGSDRYFAEACVARGIEVVAARDTSAFRNGMLAFPPEVLQLPVTSQTDTEAILTAPAHADLSLADFDGVHTNFEYAVVMAAGPAAAAGLPGPGTGVAVLMRDKYLQKQRLGRSGVAVAASKLFWSPPTAASVEDMGFPLVLKPVAGAGTDATTRVEDPDSFRRVVATFYAKSAHRGLLIEQFVEGEEFILDGWIHDGIIHFSSLGRYAQTCLEATNLGTALRVFRCSDSTHPDLQERAAKLASEALGALGLRSGVFHLEFFRTPDDRLVFGECAARRGGGLTEEAVLLSHSVSLAEASVDLCLGATPKVPQTAPTLEVGDIQPKLPSGVVFDLPRIEDLSAMDGVEYVRYFTYLGATSAGSPGSSRKPAAAMLVSASTPADLDTRIDQVEEAFLCGTVVIPNNTPRHMREFQVAELGRDDLRDRAYVHGKLKTSDGGQDA